jgi:hypothetical protein
MANKTILVAQREFLENVRTKTFWVGILMFRRSSCHRVRRSRLMEKTRARGATRCSTTRSAQRRKRVAKTASRRRLAWSIRK